MMTQHGTGVEAMVISDADASFILGTGGRTKRKLARVSRCELTVTQTERETTLEFKGTPESIDRAKCYVGFVMQQRIGPVKLQPETIDRDDLVILDIPHECVGYVTGHRGQGLRSVEEEFSTLMFFTDVDKHRHPPPETEKLAIFSPCQRARQGAVLKVMSAIEQKRPGHFTADIRETISESDEFDVDIARVAEEDFSYALGKGGATRKKLARASGAILEYIGRFAFIAGDKPQRVRGREYLKWLCAQKSGNKQLRAECSYYSECPESRDDLCTIQVPMECVAYMTGHKGTALRRIEEVSSTFMFLDGQRGSESETLYIFGDSQAGRLKAKELAEKRIQEKLDGNTSQGGREGRMYDYKYGRERGGPDDDRRRHRGGPYYRQGSPSPSWGPCDAYMRRGDGDMRRGDGDMRRGDGDMRREDGDMRRGDGDMRRGDTRRGDMRRGDFGGRWGDGDMRRGHMDMRRGDSHMRYGRGDGDMRRGDGDMRRGDGDMRRGDGDMRRGDGDMRRRDGDMRRGDMKREVEDVKREEVGHGRRPTEENRRMGDENRRGDMRDGDMRTGDMRDGDMLKRRNSFTEVKSERALP